MSLASTVVMFMISITLGIFFTTLVVYHISKEENKDNNLDEDL